jgi:hypothetical protein
MNKIVRIVVMMIVGLGLLAGFGAQTAHADEIRCVGTLGAITVDNVPRARRADVHAKQDARAGHSEGSR